MPTKPAAHEPRVSDLVIESKIEATWDPATEQTTHIRTAVGVSARRRRLKTEETWKRKRILGRGAYGTVWLEERIASSGPSQDESSLRAIKEIRKRANVSAYEFHRELEAIAKFSHDRFVHCFVRSLGWFENEESLFITMEYLKYGDLQQYLTKPFPEPEVKQIALQIAEALQLMHESGFAHRDLKPGNILVLQKGPAWWVKIADFGISKRVEASTVLRTMEIGTRGFMAPEILGLYCPDDFDDDDLDADDETDEAESDALAYTPAIDLWALGEITHRMLTQKPVFVANKRLWSYVTKGTPFPTNELQSAGTSPQGIEFIERVMAASPKGRLTAEGAISHKWLDSHEFIDEARSRSSIESTRSLGPTGMTVPDDEPSAQWTATEDYAEPAAEHSVGSIPAVANQETITEETIQPNAKPFTTASEDGVIEPASETLSLHESPSETAEINKPETVVKVEEIPVSAPDLQPARSPPAKIPLHQELPVRTSQQGKDGFQDWDAISASVEDAPVAVPVNNQPKRSPSPKALPRQEPPATISQQNTVNPHDWDAVFASPEDTDATVLPDNVSNEGSNNDNNSSINHNLDATDWDAIFADIDSAHVSTAPDDILPERPPSPKTQLRQEVPAATSQKNTDNSNDWGAVFASPDTNNATNMPSSASNETFNKDNKSTINRNTGDVTGWNTDSHAIPPSVDSHVPTAPVDIQPVRFPSPERRLSHEPPTHVVADIGRETTFYPQESPDTQTSSFRSYSWQGRPQVLPDTNSETTLTPQALPYSNSETTLTPQRQEPSEVRPSHQADDTLMPNKRDLKKWWKSFRVPSKAQEVQTQSAIFGVPLRQSITYANVAISLIDENGNSYIYGYVPIVIAKCGVFLKERGTYVKKIFAQSGSARRIRELRTAFETPARYGKGVVWDGYTVHDAANVFRGYLNDLPEPVVPWDLYHRFCNLLRGATKEAMGDTELPQTVEYFDQGETISRYQQLFKELPPLNRQLLIYVLDLLAVFASKSDDNEMPATNLASLFQPSILAHPEALEDRRLNECVLIFLIDNQDHFLIGM